jgi:ribosomal protein S18 acetylase RimI-like enzyme
MQKEDLKIIKLPVGRWQEYKELRLKALKQDAVAFGSAYQEVVLRDDEYWKTKLTSEQSISLFAEVNGKLVGMIAAYWEKDMKLKHIANIASVYVDQDYRGLKIGKRLMQEIFNQILLNKNIIKIKLSVVTTQQPAINLYQSFGFEIIGTTKKELLIAGKYYDEYLLEKLL